MKILHSWLKEFADFGDDIDALAERITELGLAVESVEHVGTPVKGVVTAQVLRLEKHPDAAKVTRVYVDAGDGVERHVWCGATNMQAGDVVPLATLGTNMPDGRVITQRGILGIDSEGMLCSGTEIGLSSDGSGLLILPKGTALGRDVYEALGVDSDVVFDLDVTRNRPDCTGYLGVARDVAAGMGKSLTLPRIDQSETGKSLSVPVAISAPERCSRFTVQVMSGISITQSPDWIARRLARAGMRSINNVVDVSNLVNLELNQPNHAYDFDSVKDGFIVRLARDGEQFTTLDAVERTLSTGDLLICNAQDKPVGIAGIMGGLDSEVTEATTSIAVEIAYFEPDAVRATSNRLALRTEASLRFERGVDPFGAEFALARFAELLRITCPGLVVHAGITDVRTDSLPEQVRTTQVRLNTIKRVLGIDVTAQSLAQLITPIGFTMNTTAINGEVEVGIPSWRNDCTSEIDIVEEVARHYGYDNLGKIVPTSPVHGRLSDVQKRRRLLREIVVSLGVSEAMPNPFLAPGELAKVGLSEDNALRLANPLVAEESVLRTSLLPGMLKSIAYNQSHRIRDISLFEIGHVYPQGTEILPDEFESLCIMVAGADASIAMDMWSQVSAGLGIGAQLAQDQPPAGYHGTRSALLKRGKVVLGAVGEIDPTVLANEGIVGRVACLEVNLSVVLSEVPKPQSAQLVSKFPSSDFDLAFVVGNTVSAASMMKAIRQAGGNLLVDVALFDIYRGKGVSDDARSLAYRLRLQAPDRTLTDVEVSEVRAKCIAAAEKLGATLRG
ncbi:MAG: phenylalanine--tRNA ligase subunit beta [Ilumatobacteraceae bacterium]